MSALETAVGREPVWEVTDPAGTVLVRAEIELADDVYRHAPAGSHLRLADQHMPKTPAVTGPRQGRPGASSAVTSTVTETAA